MPGGVYNFHPASPSLVLSRHGRTDVMAMKDALAPAHPLGGRATVPAHQRRQPPRSLRNDADHRAGRPPPPCYMGLTAGHRCLDRRRNCPIAQVRYTYTNGAALSAVRFMEIHYCKPSSQPGHRRLTLVDVADVFFCKHVTGLQRKCG